MPSFLTNIHFIFLYQNLHLGISKGVRTPPAHKKSYFIITDFLVLVPVLHPIRVPVVSTIKSLFQKPILHDFHQLIFFTSGDRDF